jgi:hypothetical protein
MTPQVPGQDHHIRAEANASHWGHGGWQVWENDYEALLKIVRSTDPGHVASAGAAYLAIFNRMNETVGLLYSQAQKLAENWGGADADAAMKQMQKAYEQANEISTKSSGTGNALNAHATMLTSWKNTLHGEHWYGVEVGTGGTDTGDWLKGESAMGRQLMEKLQNQTVESNGNFPDGIRQDMANPSVDEINPNRVPPGGHPPGGGGGGHLPGGGGGPGHLAGGGNGPGHLPGGGNGPGHLPGGGNGPGHLPGGNGPGHLPGGPNGGHLPHGGGTELAGLPSSGGGGLGAGGGGLGGGLGAGAAGAGSLGSAGAGPGGLGAGGLGAMPGMGGGLAGKNSPGGPGGMPMGAGAGQGRGGDEEERERTTWLVEDEDVWGADGDATPPVIG